MLFEELKEINDDPCPILLLDNSGSTADHLRGKTILETYAHVINKLIKKDRVNMLFWNNSDINTFYENVSIESTTNIINRTYSGGGTDVSYAFHYMPKSWLTQEKESIDIYILTDGQTNSGRYHFPDQITNLCSNKNVNLHIVTVESNSANYENANYESGTEIYQTLKENNLMKYVRSFVAFNELFFDNYYKNFYNPILEPQYIMYKDKCFHETKLNQFICYIEEQIETINDINVNLFVFNLAQTVYKIVATKTKFVKSGIINMFLNLLKGLNVSNVHLQLNSFLNEVNNHLVGKSNSFQDYRNNRNNLFERAQNDIHNNVKASVCSNYNDMFFTLPQKTSNGKTLIFKSNFDQINGSVRLDDKKYNFGGINVNDHVIPIFPINNYEHCHDRTEFSNQCIRQWIRANYSKLYNVTTNSDLMLYIFLTDMVTIYLSTNDETIKEAVRTLSLIMLDRKRFASGFKIDEENESINKTDHDNIKEIVFLESNPPTSQTKGVEMDEIFNICLKKANLNWTPEQLWLSIVLMVGNEKIIKKQFELFGQFREKLSLFTSKSTSGATFSELVDTFIKPLLSDQQIEIINYTTLEELDYVDYMTLEETDQIGGYKIAEHTFGKNIICKPKFVISEETRLAMIQNHIGCPFCNFAFQGENFFIKVEPKDDSDQLDNKILNYNLISLLYNKLNHKVVDLTIDDQNNGLVMIDSIDWSNNTSFEFADNIHLIKQTMDKTVVEINNLTDFKLYVTNNYNWVNELMLSGFCVAGGFCKSILLGQPINDVDFFICNGGTIVEIKLFINYAKSLLESVYVNCQFITIYKRNNNVIELLCCSKKKEFENDDCLLSDSTFDKYNLIHKIQLITVSFSSIQSIFDAFDLDSSKVAFDGSNVFFCQNSVKSYMYLVNYLNNMDYEFTHPSRVIKYLKYGFKVASKDPYTKILGLRSSEKINYVNADTLRCDQADQDTTEIESANMSGSSFEKECDIKSTFDYIKYYNEHNDDVIIYSFDNYNDIMDKIVVLDGLNFREKTIQDKLLKANSKKNKVVV
jgi:hypothetical protein